MLLANSLISLLADPASNLAQGFHSTQAWPEDIANVSKKELHKLWSKKIIGSYSGLIM